MHVTLNHYLTFSAILFCMGLYGALSKRSAIAVMMCLELMANAVNINLIALARYVTPTAINGQFFAIFVMVVAAAEVGLGLAIVLSIYRQRSSIDVQKVNLLKW